jgi:hypothetical protein
MVPVYSKIDFRWTDPGGNLVEHLEGQVPLLSDVVIALWTIRIRQWVLALGVNAIPFAVLFVVNLLIILALYK